MLRVIHSLFPSYTLTSSCLINCDYLLNLTINDDCFLLNISTDDPFVIQNLFPQKITHILPYSYTNTDSQYHFSLSLSSESEQKDIQLTLPLELLIHEAYQLQLIHTKSLSTIKALFLELFCFMPRFLPPKIWTELPEKDLQTFFHYLLTQGLVTPKMFALFFKYIDLPNITLFFSKRIGQEILEEFTLLSDYEDPKLLKSVYYIIERNIIIYLKIQKKTPYILLKYQQLLIYHQHFYYTTALASLELSQFDFFMRLDSSFIPILNKIPYSSIVSFLAHSHPSNIFSMERFFSKQGFITLKEDCYYCTYDITQSQDFIYLFARIYHSQTQISLENIIKDHLTKDRDWELLVREGSLDDFLIIMDHYPKIVAKIGGILKTVYQLYHKQSLIIPRSNQNSLNQAIERMSITIYYLYFLKILA